jgi:hypothetical protein
MKTVYVDPILRELWKIKDGLSNECGHDLRRLFDRLKESQKDCPGRLVNRTNRAMRVAESKGPGYGAQTRRT